MNTLLATPRILQSMSHSHLPMVLLLGQKYQTEEDVLLAWSGQALYYYVLINGANGAEFHNNSGRARFGVRRRENLIGCDCMIDGSGIARYSWHTLF